MYGAVKYLMEKLNIPEDCFSEDVYALDVLLTSDFGKYLVKTFRFDLLNNKDALFEIEKLFQYSNFNVSAMFRYAPVFYIINFLWKIHIFVAEFSFCFLKITSTDLDKKESFTYYTFFFEQSKQYSKKYWLDESAALFCMDSHSDRIVEVTKVVLDEDCFKTLMELILNPDNYNDIADHFKKFKTEKYDEFMKGKSVSVQLS